MRKPPALVSSISASGRPVMSMSRRGLATFSFIRSMRLVPPAMNLAFGSRAIWLDRVAHVARLDVIEGDHGADSGGAPCMTSSMAATMFG